MSEELYEVCENLKKEIRQLNEKPDISPSSPRAFQKSLNNYSRSLGMKARHILFTNTSHM